LQTGGIPALGTLTTLQKVMADLGIKTGLQQMSGGVFGGQPEGQPQLPRSLSSTGATATESKPVPANDPTMTIPPRQVAAANAPQPQAVPQQPPQQQQVPLPPQRPMVPQAVPQPVAQRPPVAPPPGMVVGPDGRLSPDLTQVPQPPVPQVGTAGMSPATEAALHAAGLVPESRTVAQHVNILQRGAALAASTGVRNAGQPYNDALNNIAKFIEQRSAPTDMQKNYEMEVRQGFKGSFDQYQTSQMSQDLRFAVDKDTMKEIGTQAAQMVRIRPLLDEALRLSEKSGSGYAGQLLPYWSKVVSAFGINPGEVATNTEALRSIAQQLVPLVRQPGATSNYEAQLYLDAVISPGLSEQARVKVGNMIVKLVDRSLAVAKVYRQNAGSPDLYDKIGELDKSPIFSPGERAFLQVAADKTRATNERQPTSAEVAAEQARRAQRPR
jgi:hypothetical protein